MNFIYKYNCKNNECLNHKCPNKNTFVLGPTGPSGATGPTGSNANSATCFCVDQMRNIS